MRWTSFTCLVWALVLGALAKEWRDGPRTPGAVLSGGVGGSAGDAGSAGEDRNGEWDWNPEDRNARREVFTRVYKQNAWGSEESRSGWGSGKEYTANARRFIESVLSNSSYGIRRMADAPCGDQTKSSGLDNGRAWARQIPSIANGAVTYTGFDIVPELVSANRADATGASGRAPHFEVLDLVAPDAFQMLRGFDLVLTRDALQHMHVDEAMLALRNIEASGARYLITNYHRHPALVRHGVNPNLLGTDDRTWQQWEGGRQGQGFRGFFPIDVLQAPFSLPEPIASAEEGIPNSATYDHKRIGIWRLPILGPAAADPSAWEQESMAALSTILSSSNVHQLIGAGGALFMFNQQTAAHLFYDQANRANPLLARALHAGDMLRRGDLEKAGALASEVLSHSKKGEAATLAAATLRELNKLKAH